MISVRNLLVGLAIAFTAYLAARGLWWTSPVPYPLVLIATLAFYLVATWLCVLWEPPRPSSAAEPEPDAPAEHAAETDDPPADADASASRPRHRLPRWAAVLAIAVAIVVPNAVAFGVDPDERTASFATWYLGGIGALMAIVMVRRRPWVAWAGVAILAVESIAWMGPADALSLGLVGSIVWVGAAQLLVMSMDRAAHDTERLTRLQRAASGWQAAQAVRQRERRVQVQQALTIAGPILARAVATGGVLDDDDRLEARVAEGMLRDELRGPRLLDDDVRAQLERARRRGATVTVLDEGGLDGLDDDALADIRAQLAETLRGAHSDRLYIRTSRHEPIAVTVVGRSASDKDHADEDVVDLWREILHHRS